MKLSFQFSYRLSGIPSRSGCAVPQPRSIIVGRGVTIPLRLARILEVGLLRVGQK